MSKCPTVLLKADTGADVNLMNSNTFDKLIQDRRVLRIDFIENGSIWKQHSSKCARKVPCLSQMEGSCL